MNEPCTIAMKSSSWVDGILERFQTTYVGPEGLLISQVDAAGHIVNGEPLLADFGDALPFLQTFGLGNFVEQQIILAQRYLWRGLYQRQGRVELFYNHDWLLGLLDLYRQTRRTPLLALAEQAAATLEENFFRGDFLLNERPMARDWRTWLLPTSPFNGGYIELWLELHEHTGCARYLENARRLACAWTETDRFQRSGVFERILCLPLPRLSALLLQGSRLRARLFKDNTNLCWGLFTLWQATGDPQCQAALEHWLGGFTRYFWNDGYVFLHLDARLKGWEPSLKAAFSSLDLLCDLTHGGLAPQQCLRLGQSIADFWLGRQWDNGLFPIADATDQNHLDANTDMAVALAKLCALTGRTEYWDAAMRCASALPDLHRTSAGYCLRVNRQGKQLDGHVIVKYQSLLLKLALLPDAPAHLYADRERLQLLRDR